MTTATSTSDKHGWPVYYELEEGGTCSGGVHFFCSEQCREIAPTAGYGTEIIAGTQPDIDLADGTVCENCGRYLTAPSGVMELRQFHNDSKPERITIMRKIRLFLLGMYEFRQVITTSLNSTIEMDTYDRGRELAHLVTLRLFEEA